jgi:peptide/nickel transport system substrate-binding protein
MQVLVMFVMMVSGGYGLTAAELTVGTRPEPAVDPHFLYFDSNVAYSSHIFDSLTIADEDMKRKPGLATSWTAIDDTTWEFKLRRGVTFHDGSDFTAEDVVATLNRVPKVPNNPNPYTGTIRSIVSKEVIDSHTIRFKTDAPDPLLPIRLSDVAIISKKVGERATTADFKSGKAAIGTGPFKFVKYSPGDRLVLERNANYWGDRPAWERVTFKIISNDAARLAALMGGDVDVIDYLPPLEIANLEKNPKISVFKRPTGRVMYFIPNLNDKSSFVTTDGKPLGKNPLRDLRVRKALSMAIDRNALSQKVMQGLAVPAYQFVPEGMLGYNTALAPVNYSPSDAKKLLAEAGYPNGFGMTIHGPSDRFVNDAKVCQAVGQMLSKIGLAIKVETMPANVYFSRLRRSESELSFFLSGWGNTSGEFTPGLVGVLHSYDKAKNMGYYNHGSYSNSAVDKIAEEAASINDIGKREKRLQMAMATAMNDLAIIPLYVQFTAVAARKGIIWPPRADEQTRIMSATPVK